MSTAIRILGLLSVLFVVGCQSTESRLAEIENYLNAPSPTKLNKPVFFIMQDQRPDVERKFMPDSRWAFWSYTVDMGNPNQASLSLGKYLADSIRRKDIARQASYGLPTDPTPTNVTLVHIGLLSWYGRLENPLPVTGLLKSLITPGALLHADGHCKFSSVLEDNGQKVDLGVSEGLVESGFPHASKPSVYREGEQLSGAAASDAMAKFFKALEKKLQSSPPN